MIAPSELHLCRQAEAHAAAPMRHALDAFLVAINVEEEARVDIVTAVGEALANAIEHAYESGPAGDIELLVRMKHGTRVLSVDVIDRGNFVQRSRRENRGFGLLIVKAIARTMTIDMAHGTTIRMIFDAPTS